MTIILGLLLAGGALEILLTNPLWWRVRRAGASALLALNGVLGLWLILSAPGEVFVWVVAGLSLYRLFNLYRMRRSQIQSEHLRRISLTTASRLWLMQLAVALVGLLGYYGHWHVSAALICGLISCGIGLVLLASTWRSIRIARSIRLSTRIVGESTPTLSVCIPARNETESLNACLSSLVAGDYPKLEILVLDDHSTDRHTPEVIRSFAHAGVEFIPGRRFGGEWLAKNWAYQQLLEAANGELVLFCGADTRFAPDSLRFLVSALVTRNKTMLSVLPRNDLPPLTKLWIQPLRYAWELGLPRRRLNRPPVLSTCWLAQRSFLNQSGGFKAVSRRITPESFFAKLALAKDGYSFFHYPELMSQKPAAELVETAVRLRYPQLHHRVEAVALLALIETIGCLFAPIAIIIGLIGQNYPVLILGVLAFGLLGISLALVFKLTYRRRLIRAYILWPVLIVCDLLLAHLSMWRYEFGTVLWKGRSVSPRVMQRAAPSDR